MPLQLALDRLPIEKAIQLAHETTAEVDWIEIGTSLVKEFGVQSIQAFRNAFPNKTLVADMKINDNAKYECKLAFEAGADVITVMGTAPLITIETVHHAAEQAKKTVMIDLLNTSVSTQQALHDTFPQAIFCIHTSKDQQEESEKTFSLSGVQWNDRRIAVAGGISTETLPVILENYKPYVYIIGSAITKHANRLTAAKQFQQIIKGVEN